MTLWTLAALLFGAMVAASMLPARTAPPTLIVVQAPEPAITGGVGLPLLLLIVAVVTAAIIL